jgi:hypothetical protein
MRARADSVNSRKLATGPVRSTGGLLESSAGGGSQSSLLGRRSFWFSSQEIFLRSSENKIHFFLVDFSGGF